MKNKVKSKSLRMILEQSDGTVLECRATRAGLNQYDNPKTPVRKWWGWGKWEKSKIKI